MLMGRKVVVNMTSVEPAEFVVLSVAESGSSRQLGTRRVLEYRK